LYFVSGIVNCQFWGILSPKIYIWFVSNRDLQKSAYGESIGDVNNGVT